MDPTVVSAKYFDKNFQHFEHVEDWWDIPTPVFQSIMDYQKFDKEVSKWLYVMGGRCACFTSHRRNSVSPTSSTKADFVKTQVLLRRGGH